MGLFDKLKKPKWQHKDHKVRLEAVKELDAALDDIEPKLAEREVEYKKQDNNKNKSTINRRKLQIY